MMLDTFAVVTNHLISATYTYNLEVFGALTSREGDFAGDIHLKRWARHGAERGLLDNEMREKRNNEQ